MWSDAEDEGVGPPGTTEVADAPFSGGVHAPGRARIAARTLREDRWWLQPFVTFVCFTRLAALRPGPRQPRRGTTSSPTTATSRRSRPRACRTSCVPGSAHFGTPFGELPAAHPVRGLTLPFLLLFRLTCYYYRKAYYRSFWCRPPACAVRRAAPMLLGRDAVPAHRAEPAPLLLLRRRDHLAHQHLGRAARVPGQGRRLRHRARARSSCCANVVLLWCYTLGCHSCRNIVGGRLNHFSQHPLRYQDVGLVRKLNARHMQFAWITLGSLVVTDAYIALVSSGASPTCASSTRSTSDRRR